MKTISPGKTGKKLTSSSVCERYGITRRTLGRWMQDPSLGFPEPIDINGRHYFEESGDEGLEGWERSRAASTKRGR